MSLDRKELLETSRQASIAPSESTVPFRLTVDHPSKVDIEIAKRENRNTFKNNRRLDAYISTAYLWISGYLIFIVSLSCLVAGKISIIFLSSSLQSLGNNSSNSHGKVSSLLTEHLDITTIDYFSILSSNDEELSNADVEKYNNEASLLMLMISLCIPYLTTFIRSVWCGAWRADRLWPSFSSICVGFVSAVLESVGSVFIVIEVFSCRTTSLTLKTALGVCILYVPIALHFLSNDRQSVSRFRNLSLFLALIGCFMSIVFISLLQASQNSWDFSKTWPIIAGITCLSLAWCPTAQRLQLLPRKQKLYRLLRERNERISNFIIDFPLNSSIGSSVVYELPEYSSRWKVSIITSFLKIVIILTFGILYAHFLHLIEFPKLAMGAKVISPSHPAFSWFMVNIFCSMGSYVLLWAGCTISLQKPLFWLPLLVSGPVSCVVMVLFDLCIISSNQSPPWCSSSATGGRVPLFYLVPVLCCAVVTMVLSVIGFAWNCQPVRMQKESKLFWLPGYTSILSDSYLLLSRSYTRLTDRGLGFISSLRRTDEEHQSQDINPSANNISRMTRTIICTTMYRESADEMRQLLVSLDDINMAKQQGCGRAVESHIVFDNGAKEKRPTMFARQLIYLCKKVFAVTSDQIRKIETPYGLQLVLSLPSHHESETSNVDNEGGNLTYNNQPMVLTIHLKDNQKVKNKKRWSQVMYMSLVLDKLIMEDDQEGRETFILTTDADIKFTHESLEVLLDLLHRNSNVGAVCARTHPLGNGPIYWYQIFDYAIGHWLFKPAEHMLGSVLCAPGCFSVYRAEAIRDVLTTFSSKVEHAIDFLTKDMGEDRYLATLLIQSGWRIEYCAAAAISTFCPVTFDEFFKQRRRWLPSTVANQLLLLRQWRSTVSRFNGQMSLTFFLYEALLFLSTAITPSVSIMVIVGGLYYAWGTNQLLSVLLLVALSVIYAFICLYAGSSMQLKVSKILTFALSLAMGAVLIGTITQIVQENFQSGGEFTSSMSHIDQHDLHGNSSSHGAMSLKLSVTTNYLVILIGIFLLCAVLHATEFYCLLHGIWYVMCMPAVNILLLIYSVCNLNDGSWGTREEKAGAAENLHQSSLFENLSDAVRNLCPCFRKERADSRGSECSSPELGPTNQVTEETRTPEVSVASQRKSKLSYRDSCVRFKPHGEKWKTLLEWLPENLARMYAGRFIQNGYDNTSFITGLTDDELKAIGIESSLHRSALLEAIGLLPELELEMCVPRNVDKWLKAIGLEMYKDNFRRSQILTSSNMEILRGMNYDDIERELNITKRGHIRRLILATEKLRYPNKADREMWRVKEEIDDLPMEKLIDVKPLEYNFWERLRQKCLKPSSSVFANSIDIKNKLTEARNSSLITLSVSNAMWLLLVCTLVSKTDLNLFKTNALGLVLVVIFTFLLLLQLACMIAHRFSTWLHQLARAPRWCGDLPLTDFSFADAPALPSTAADELLASNRFEGSVDLGTGTGSFGAEESERARVKRSFSAAVASMNPQRRNYGLSDERRPLMQ